MHLVTHLDSVNGPSGMEFFIRDYDNNYKVNIFTNGSHSATKVGIYMTNHHAFITPEEAEALAQALIIQAAAARGAQAAKDDYCDNFVPEYNDEPPF